MKDIETNLGQIESRFADVVWENEPISTSDLIKICNKKFDWKRTTTYTVLKNFAIEIFLKLLKE